MIGFLGMENSGIVLFLVDRFPIWPRISARIAPNMACLTHVEKYLKITKQV